MRQEVTARGRRRPQRRGAKTTTHAQSLSSWPTQHLDAARTGGVRLHADALHVGWTELLAEYAWDAFVTLTFDPKRWPKRDRRLAERETRRWLQEVEWVFRCSIGWAFAAERDRSDEWHTHVLVVGIGRRKWTAPMAMWEERCGFIDVRPVWLPVGIAEYVTKATAWTGTLELSDTLPRYRNTASRRKAPPTPTP